MPEQKRQLMRSLDRRKKCLLIEQQYKKNQSEPSTSLSHVGGLVTAAPNNSRFSDPGLYVERLQAEDWALKDIVALEVSLRSEPLRYDTQFSFSHS